MNASEIEATFPNKHRLPEPISDICRYVSARGYPISGCFEISKIGMSDVRAWFPDDTEAQAAFLPFGRGACGEVYAIWLTEGLPPDSAPVIMLGSEGQLEVLAIDSREFCRLLCLGYSEIGSDDPDSPPSDFEETKPFRDFIQAKYHFDLPTTAGPIVGPEEGVRLCSLYLRFRSVSPPSEPCPFDLNFRMKTLLARDPSFLLQTAKPDPFGLPML